MSDTRVVEVTSCGECPYLDARWSQAPWGCDLSCDSEMVQDKETIADGCELLTKEEYSEASDERR